MKHTDVLGNELKDGDKVVTISKNFRAQGGILVVMTIKIEKDKLGFVEPTGMCYSRNIGQVCVKVFWSFEEWLTAMKEGSLSDYVPDMSDEELLVAYNKDVSDYMGSF